MISLTQDQSYLGYIMLSLSNYPQNFIQKFEIHAGFTSEGFDLEMLISEEDAIFLVQGLNKMIDNV
jgi:hypothetical protein